MKKIAVAVLILVLGVFVFARGNQEKKESGNENFADGSFREIEDHAGNKVRVPKEINRIAVTGIYPLPSVLTVFFNSAEKIVSMNTPSLSAAKAGLLGELYPEILKVNDKPVSSGGSKINAEELASLNPDVVFYSTIDEGDILLNAGIPAVAVSANKWDYNAIETLDRWLELLGEIFPSDADKVKKVHEFSLKAYNLVQERVKDIPEDKRSRVFVLFQYTPSDIKTSGAHFFGDWWCRAIGAVNVAHEIDMENAVSVNMEQIYAWNPDVVLITNFTPLQPETLLKGEYNGDDWSFIKAVKDGRVYKMPLGMYRGYTPGVDTPITLLYLAKTVYPALFEDIDITQYAKEYYSSVFGIELSEEQVYRIFSPLSSAANGMF